MSFEPKAILQGNADKRALEENPTVGFTASGAATENPTADIGKDVTRMAGPGGAFAFKMMQDPQYAQNIAGWNSLFRQSVPGAEFYQVQNQTEVG